MLEEREAFLRAIFDAPDDDLPRLVFADWLDDHGEEVPARAIRLAIEVASLSQSSERNALDNPVLQLLNEMPDMGSSLHGLLRDFPTQPPRMVFDAAHVLSTESFRQWCVQNPHSFSSTRITVRGRQTRITDTRFFDCLFQYVALRRVTELDLAGEEEALVSSTVTNDGGGIVGLPTYESRLVPTITLAGVEALTQHRGVRRLTAIDLRNNNLGNDALRFLARSPYLENLKRLELSEGNQFRGRVWAQLLERFGEEVVW